MIRNDDREPALTTSPLTRLYEGSRRSAPLRFLPVNQTARRIADLYCSSPNDIGLLWWRPSAQRAAAISPHWSERVLSPGLTTTSIGPRRAPATVPNRLRGERGVPAAARCRKPGQQRAGSGWAVAGQRATGETPEAMPVLGISAPQPDRASAWSVRGGL